MAAEKRDLQMKSALERDVRLVRCEDGRLEIALESAAAKTLVNELSRKLKLWTGRNWMVVVSGDAGAPTLKSQADAKQAAAGNRRARRSAGEGGAGTLARRGDYRRARARRMRRRRPPSGGRRLPPADEEGSGDNWATTG